MDNKRNSTDYEVEVQSYIKVANLLFKYSGEESFIYRTSEKMNSKKINDLKKELFSIFNEVYDNTNNSPISLLKKKDNNNKEYYLKKICELQREFLPVYNWLETFEKNKLELIYKSIQSNVDSENMQKKLNEIISKKINFEKYSIEKTEITENDINELLNKVEINKISYEILNLNPENGWNSLDFNKKTKLYELSKLNIDTLEDILKTTKEQRYQDTIKEFERILFPEKKESKVNKKLSINNKSISFFIDDIFNEVLLNSKIKKYFSTRISDLNLVSDNITEISLLEINDLKHFKESIGNISDVDKIKNFIINKQLKSIRKTCKKNLLGLGCKESYIKNLLDNFFLNYDFNTINKLNIILKNIDFYLEGHLKKELILKVPTEILNELFYDDFGEYNFQRKLEITTINPYHLIFFNNNLGKETEDVISKILINYLDDDKNDIAIDDTNFLINIKNDKLKDNNYYEEFCYSYIMTKEEKKEIRKQKKCIGEYETILPEAFERFQKFINDLKID